MFKKELEVGDSVYTLHYRRAIIIRDLNVVMMGCRIDTLQHSLPTK